MKKILILASVLLLAGAGCTTKTQQKPTANVPADKNADKVAEIIPEAEEKSPIAGENIEKKTRPPEVNISSEQNTIFETAFAEKSTEAGFKIYYPTFIPANLKLDETSLSISKMGETGKIVTFNLNDITNPTMPLVFIQEQTEGIALNPENLKEGETAYLNGYIKTITNDAGSFYVLLFLKDDKTSIRISTKTDVMDLDTLSKLAESMK